jgi:hypothetical protein
MDLGPPELFNAFYPICMPQFCRHNRLIQNCPICSREQAIEPRPLVSSSAPRVAEPRRRATGADRPAQAGRSAPGQRSGRSAGVTIRRLRTSVDDGYRSPLAPGLRSSDEARRLADELAYAQTRLRILGESPPGLYAQVADPAGDLEERTWLAFLIAYLGPLEDVYDPFASIREIRTSWASGEVPKLGDVQTGPRTAHDPSRPAGTVEAYRAWAKRAGSQANAYGGEPPWPADRRFARAYERLALPGLHRDARFELLTSLGVLGLYDMRAGSLALGGGDQVTLAAKRALGIGDPMLLDRRAAQLAHEAGLDLGALDLGFHNWEQGQRSSVGLGQEAEPDADTAARVSDALGI